VITRQASVLSVAQSQTEEGRSRCHPGNKARKQGNKHNNRVCKVCRRDNNNSSWSFNIGEDPDPLPLDVQESWSV